MPRYIHAPPIPKYIVIDVSWVDYIAGCNSWFFNKFPIREIIEFITKIPVYEDCTQQFWDEVEHRFTSDELSADGFDIIDLIFEAFIEEFYNRLNRLLPYDNDYYMFHCWADNDTLIMVREDLRFEAVIPPFLIARRI